MGKKLTPLVSVLVPTYNGERFLAETLDSIRAQRHRNIEVIIRDDQSSDGTVAIAEQFVARDKRFRLVHAEQNGGGLANCIALMKLAKGRFIKFCLQDDLLEPECVELLLAPMIADARIVLSTSSRLLIDEHGNELPPKGFTIPLSSENTVFEGKQLIRGILELVINFIGEPSTTLFRNHLIPPDELFCFGPQQSHAMADLAGWLHLLLKGNLYYHATPLSRFRQHSDQLSQRWDIFFNSYLDAAKLLQGAVQYGLYPNAPDLQNPKNRVLGWLGEAKLQARSSTDERMRAFLPELDDAIATLSSL